MVILFIAIIQVSYVLNLNMKVLCAALLSLFTSVVLIVRHGYIYSTDHKEIAWSDDAKEASMS